MLAAPLGLLGLLPREVGEAVVSMVQGKAALRSTCRSLNLVANACTSALRWSGPHAAEDAAQVGAAWPALLQQMTALKVLDCSGQHGTPLLIRSLAGCPPTVRTVKCCLT